MQDEKQTSEIWKSEIRFACQAIGIEFNPNDPQDTIARLIEAHKNIEKRKQQVR